MCSVTSRPWKRRWFSAGAGLALSTSIHAATPAVPTHGQVADCRPELGLSFVCGTGAVEEMVAVPGTPWMLAGALNVGTSTGFHLIDRVHHTARPLTLQVGAADTSTGSCGGPPDLKRWSIDGLAIAPFGKRRWRLFAANHGDRNAVELMTFEAGPAPLLRWTGCVAMPRGTLPNAIAAAPGGFVVTSFYNPGDAQSWRRLARRETVSSAWRWRGSGDLVRLSTGPLSGANGIALSPDSRSVYISAWAQQALVEVNLATGKRRKRRLSFLPDNLHFDLRNRLLIAGQRASVSNIAACSGPCPIPWIVVELDTATNQMRTVGEGPGTTAVNYVCGAQIIGNELWLTVRGQDRVAWRDLDHRQLSHKFDERDAFQRRQ